MLELGVVNSQVQVKQVMDLLEDVEFGKALNRVGNDYNGLNTFMKALKKTQKFAQDAYTAEDDFWKIFTFLGEQRKITDAYKNAGLQFGQTFIDPKGKKQIFNEEYVKKAAADLVKNVGGVIDNLHTSKEEKLEAERKIKELVANYEVEMEKNITARWEADLKSDSWPVSYTHLRAHET